MLVSSSVDPSFVVRVPKDGRFNFDKVLDEKLQENLKEWDDGGVPIVDGGWKPSENVLEELVVITPPPLVVHSENAMVEEPIHDKSPEKSKATDVLMNSASAQGVATTTAGVSLGHGGAQMPAVFQAMAGGDQEPEASHKTHRRRPKGTSKRRGRVEAQQPENEQSQPLVLPPGPFVPDGILGKGDASNRVSSSNSVPTTIPQIPNEVAGDKANGEKMDFVGKFKENRLQGNGFKFSHFDFPDGKIVLDDSDEVPVEEAWGYCLIGCFTGLFPGRSALEFIVKGWNVKCRVIPYGKGWTVFRFLNETDRLKVFHGGPYMTFGKTLMLKMVEKGVFLSDDLFMKVPTWVRLHEVPPQFWSCSGLGKIVSKIGVPLYSDKVTKDRTMMNYARCLVEVDVSKTPELEYEVHLSGGGKFLQRISFEHYPDYCCDCKRFGHNVFKCKKDDQGNYIPEPPPKPQTKRPERRPGKEPMHPEKNAPPTSSSRHERAPPTAQNKKDSAPRVNANVKKVWKRVDRKEAPVKNTPIATANKFDALTDPGVPCEGNDDVIIDTNMENCEPQVAPSSNDPNGGTWQVVGRKGKKNGCGEPSISSVDQ